jgi:hypothetical protein
VGRHSNNLYPTQQGFLGRGRKQAAAGSESIGNVAWRISFGDNHESWADQVALMCDNLLPDVFSGVDNVAEVFSRDDSK